MSLDEELKELEQDASSTEVTATTESRSKVTSRKEKQLEKETSSCFGPVRNLGTACRMLMASLDWKSDNLITL